jgi:serine/threonine-protein kinase
MKRDVAVKILPPSLALSPDYLERFNREAEIIARLEHPHIVPVYEFGTEQGFTFVVMRLVAGGSLAKRIRRYGLPSLGETRDLYQQLASALDYAHRQNVIHRDVKPGNVLIDLEGNAYLADFGIAKLVGSTVLTQGTGIGTAAYMAPELARGEPYDGRVDIYGLGVMLFGLLTGQPPYQAETNDAIIYQHIHEPIPSARQYNPALPESLDAIIFRAMAKTPEDRYQTCKDLADDLTAAIADLPPELNPEAHTDVFTMPLPPSPVPVLRAAGGTDSPLPAVQMDSRRRRLAWAFSLLLIGVVGLLGYMLFVDDESPDSGEALNAADAADTLVAELATQTAHASNITPSPLPTNTPDATQTVQALVDLRFTETALAAAPELTATAATAAASTNPVVVLDQVVRDLYEQPEQNDDVEPAADVSNIRLPITGITEDKKFYRVHYENRDLWLRISADLTIEGDIDDLEVVSPGY